MISAIVCVDENWGIGSNGDLLVNIPEDMKFFKTITSNSLIVMGRKTYDSLRIKPLPNRINIVITSDIDNKNCLEARKDGSIRMSMETFKNDLPNYLNFLPWDIWVIGGASVYNELLPYCEQVYITKVYNSYDNADTYFPNIDNIPEWEIIGKSEMKTYEDIEYQFFTYRKKDAE